MPNHTWLWGKEVTPGDPWAFQRWAYQTKVGTPARKAVLMVLATMADASTGRCEPLQETLAEACETSDRTIREHLKAMEATGVIARRRQHRYDGSRRGDEFLLLAPWVREWPDGVKVDLPEESSAPTGGDHLPEDSDRSNRKQASAQERPLGTTASLSDFKGKEIETAIELPSFDETSAEPSRVGAGGRAREGRGFSHKRRKVSAELAASAERLLDVFNDATGAKFKARKRSGDPTEELKQIVGAMLDREEVTEAEWTAGVRRMAECPPSWIEGDWIVGHMFGKRSSAHTLARSAPIAAKAGGLNGGAHLKLVNGRERVDWGAIGRDLEAQGL